ncbi:MAG: LysM peptidoglycan-binding domain-containing protein [Candidatus Hydrogenedentota bacterium]
MKRLIALAVTALFLSPMVSAQTDSAGEMEALRKALEQALRENITLRADLEAAKSEIDRLRGGAERPLAMMAPSAASSAAPSAVTYMVKEGDTLGSIAAQHYGTPSAYTKIFQANRRQLTDPNRIKPGQVLTLP